MQDVKATSAGRSWVVRDPDACEILNRWRKLRQNSKAKWWAAAAVAKACLLTYEEDGFSNGFNLALSLMSDWREPTESEIGRLRSYITWVKLQRVSASIGSQHGLPTSVGMQIWELCCHAVIDRDVRPALYEVCTSAAKANPQHADEVFKELVKPIQHGRFLQMTEQARIETVPSAFLDLMRAEWEMACTATGIEDDAGDKVDDALQKKGRRVKLSPEESYAQDAVRLIEDADTNLRAEIWAGVALAKAHLANELESDPYSGPALGLILMADDAPLAHEEFLRREISDRNQLLNGRQPRPLENYRSMIRYGLVYWRLKHLASSDPGLGVYGSKFVDLAASANPAYSDAILDAAGSKLKGHPAADCLREARSGPYHEYCWGELSGRFNPQAFIRDSVSLI